MYRIVHANTIILWIHDEVHVYVYKKYSPGIELLRDKETLVGSKFIRPNKVRSDKDVFIRKYLRDKIRNKDKRNTMKKGTKTHEWIINRISERWWKYWIINKI